jgi:tetratricopeptide (TPR) repeat protein/tRNA A-37 threonylcarbamoyl transferase component Bud32
MNSQLSQQFCQACRDARAQACPHTSAAFDNVPTDSLIGTLVAERYQVQALIGSGGWGRVYRVEHVGLKKLMALKLLHSSHIFDREKIQRFKQEAEAVSKLDHPNICRVLDFAEGPEHQPCMIMELLEGQRLDEAIRGKALPLNEVLRIGVQICAALASAHQKGIVHRDLKPGNIMLVTSGQSDGPPDVKVLDFGLAKILETDVADARSLTETGGVVGTPAYMSPEQCCGRKIDGRTDVYSIGCILYEAVTGRKAFAGNSFLEILNAHLQTTPKPFTKPDSSEAQRSLEAVLLKAMDADVDRRYQTVEDMASDLNKLLRNEKVVVDRRKQRKKGALSLVAFAALALVVCCAIGGVWVWWSLGQWWSLGDDGLDGHRPDVINGKTLAQLNQAIEARPKDADAFYDRGWFHQEREERDNAIEDFSTAIELNPELVSAYIGRAEMYVLTSKFDQAFADTNKAIELAPRYFGGWGQRARVELCMENYHQAIDDAKHAISLYDEAPQATQTLAHAYGGLGQHQLALDTINRQKITDSDSGYWQNWDTGGVFMRAGQLDLAEANFKRALGFHHKMSQAWGDLAFALAGQDKMNEALPAIKKCKALDLFPARAYRLSGEMYRAGGKWDEALKEYSTSTSLEPWYGPGFVQKAMAEIALGAMNSAQLDLKKAAGLQPWSAFTHSFYALVEDQLGNEQSANDHLKKAFELTPDLPANFVNSARIKMHRGDFAGAVADCNRALTLDSRLADAYDTRAIVLEKLGKNNEATDDRKAAAKLHWHAFAVALKVSNASAGNGGSGIQVNRPDLSPLKMDEVLQIAPPKLPDAKVYALACGAIWSDRYCSVPQDNICEVCLFSPDNSRDARHELNELFGVVDRESCISTLDAVLRGDDTPGVFSDRQAKAAIAFRHIRSIAFAREACLAGYLNEGETWQRIMPAAKKIQSTFDSWDDLGRSYLDSRVAYYRGTPADAKEFAEHVSKLMTDPNRPMHRLSFKNTRLD